jgi:hypothetical protein
VLLVIHWGTAVLAPRERNGTDIQYGTRILHRADTYANPTHAVIVQQVYRWKLKTLSPHNSPAGYSTFWLLRIFKQHQTFPLCDMSTVIISIHWHCGRIEFVKLFSMYGVKLEEASSVGWKLWKKGGDESYWHMSVAPSHPLVRDSFMCDECKRCDSNITPTAVRGWIQIVCPLC